MGPTGGGCQEAKIKIKKEIRHTHISDTEMAKDNKRAKQKHTHTQSLLEGGRKGQCIEEAI